MRFAGCAATSHEAAANFGGDDIAVRARGDLTDTANPVEAMRFLAGLGSGTEKLRILAGAPRVPGLVAEAARADCEVGAGLVALLGLPSAVSDSVLCAFERYDGKGAPAGRSGADVPEPARFAAVGYAVAMFDAVGGSVQTVTRWCGRALDPEIAGLFLSDAEGVLRLSRAEDPWAAVVAAEAAPYRYIDDGDQLDDVLAGFGDAADLKSPYFQGHARGVATLARCAAAQLEGVDPGLAYRAGLVHDLGRVAVPTGVWEKPGPLNPDEWELVRLHPYHSGRILARSPVLEPLSAVVSRHHERLDGSGYPMGVRAGELDLTTRLLAAVETWRSLGEPRPYRRAMTPGEAARRISELPLDRAAVRAVLSAAEGPKPSFPALPVDLTERELDVLQLLAAGLTKKQIAERLFISASTVHTHTVHIYGKCQVSTRAALAMFAMRHGLAATP
ncbi:HD domain-containing phosphohydrolase [Nocardioides cynanchi]|uniref:HD domain-containing phosphohydrolase n=1 Tax=Nocardioides cynanchi TaxID=2558918 RepID=UPI0017800DD1|nr:HD domain-containing phosphohydrolase [Nocardioides cynanchi]